uniref:G-protein coupled receptors family 1 profile domain-containing protein n=1 Tax=Parascaris univalens TaxID=6257 RepID=A0A915AUR3_PARUN
PLALIVFFYYHILNKLREAVKGSKRLQRSSSSRAPYHRVTRLVLWVVVFHVICWSPFWLFNLFTSIFRLRIQTELDRVVINIIHLFPYINCALNPLLYAAQAENFRIAFRSLFLRRPSNSVARMARNERLRAHASCYRPSYIATARDPLLAKPLTDNCFDN